MLPPLEQLSSESKIVSLLNAANDFYHGEKTIEEGGIEIEDAEYDYLLEILEAKFPDSEYLKKVGATLSSDKKDVNLPYPMFSLDKVKLGEEKKFENWKEKMKKRCRLLKKKCQYVVSEKEDGFSVTLGYLPKENSYFFATRGDGNVGQDISNFVPHLHHTIPKWSTELRGKYIRGEMVISKDNYIAHFSGKDPRNVVKGLFGRKEVSSELQYVDFVAFDILSERLPQIEVFEFLNNHNFEIPEVYLMDEDDLEPEDLSSLLSTREKEGKYKIDGLVIVVNLINPLEERKYPTYAVAFKGSTKIIEGEVESISWGENEECTKDGYLVPVINLKKPLIFGKVSVSNITAYNARFLVYNKIGKGSIILVTRSGDVIPKIIGVIKSSFDEKRDLPSKKIFGEWRWDENRVSILLVDPSSSKGWRVKQLINFVGKMNLKGVSSSTMRTLYDAGIETIGSFIYISDHLDKLKNLPGIGARKIKLIMTRVGELSDKTFLDYMVSSNKFGHGFGERRLKPILTHFPKIQKDPTFSPEVEDLMKIEGYSTITSEGFLEGLKSFNEWIEEEELEFIRDLPPFIEIKRGKNTLQDKNIVFTGVRDQELEQKIKELGGEVKSAVSGKTNTLIVESKDMKESSSLKKARELEIEILTIPEFKEKYSIS